MEDNSSQQEPSMQPAAENPGPMEPQQNLPAQKPTPPVSIYAGIAVFALLIIGMISYILFGKNTPKRIVSIPNNQQMSGSAQNNSTVPTATPGITPVTASNADQTLNNTDASMQQSLTQMNTDLNDLNNVDTTQDNPNNL